MVLQMQMTPSEQSSQPTRAFVLPHSEQLPTVAAVECIKITSHQNKYSFPKAQRMGPQKHVALNH